MASAAVRRVTGEHAVRRRNGDELHVRWQLRELIGTAKRVSAALDDERRFPGAQRLGRAARSEQRVGQGEHFIGRERARGATGDQIDCLATIEFLHDALVAPARLFRRRRRREEFVVTRLEVIDDAGHGGGESFVSLSSVL